MGFEYLAIEKDKDYYDASLKRIDKELLKIKMFPSKNPLDVSKGFG